MSKITKLDDLEIYSESIKLAKVVFDICKNSRLNREYSLCDQLKRAAISVSANIAEGFGRRTKADFSHFLSFSISSSNEILALIDIIKVNFEDIEAKSIKDRYIVLGRRMYAFRRKLLNSNN